MTFVFYDTETTGTDTKFDQILQFAAILTDDDLNELDRFEIRCRLLPHIVPAPGALRATRVHPSQLIDPALSSHCEVMQTIAAKLNEWSPAVFIGYNSLGFDEPLLRQSFFQTLQPVYLTNTNGNTRADIYQLVRAATAYAPNCLAVPILPNGKSTLKLDQIAPANGFDHANAHDALADVEATVFMARLVRERARPLWDVLMPLAKKSVVLKLALSGRMLSLTEYYYGKPHSWLVVGCGQNPDYDAHLGVFDLQFDPADYLELPVEELVSIMNSKNKVIRSIKANAQPILLAPEHAPDGLHDIDIVDGELARRAGIIAQDKPFQERVGQALAGRYEPREPSPYVEQRIYDGFASRSDVALMKHFHEVPWDKRTHILEQIDSSDMRELGYRLIYNEHPHLMTPDKRSEFDAWCHHRLGAESTSVPWRTVASALNEADEILKEENGDTALMTDVKAWLETLMAGSPE